MVDLPLFYSLSLFFIVLLQPLLCLLIYVYIYMYTCSFVVHILPRFVDLYIIHYVFIAYKKFLQEFVDHPSKIQPPAA